MTFLFLYSSLGSLEVSLLSALAISIVSPVSSVSAARGERGGGYLTKFNTGRLRPVP